MFNTFVWQFYTESERGKRALERCSSFADALHDGAFLTLLFGLSFDDVGEKSWDADPYSVELIKAARLFAAESEITNPQQATTLFENLVFSGLSVHFSGEAEATTLTPEDIIANIQPVSIGLHLAHPEHFIPYGFVNWFDDLQRIGKLFNLALPPVPR